MAHPTIVGDNLLEIIDMYSDLKVMKLHARNPRVYHRYQKFPRSGHNLNHSVQSRCHQSIHRGYSPKSIEAKRLNLFNKINV